MTLAHTRHLAVAIAVAMLTALLAVLASSAPARAAETPVLVPSDAETVPGTHAGDSIDDPAIWVNHTSPADSLLIANDKLGALETYNVDGSLAQRIAPDNNSWGNVDVRQDLTIGAYSGDLVAVPHQGVRFYSVNHSTRQLAPINDSVLAQGLGEGLCLYQNPVSHRVYGISITIQGVLTQYEILDSDNDGLLETNTVRSFALGSEAEGCVADDDTGALYVSEEDVALWRYSAEPTGGQTREAVDVVDVDGGHLAADIEGVTVVAQDDDDGYVIVSAQNVADPNASYFSVYQRGAGNDFVNTFRVANGTSSDDCDRTDGVAATAAPLGAAFPQGIFVCQDNNNDLPGGTGNQDLKMVRLEKLVDLGEGGPPPPPPPSSSISFVGQESRNSNATSFSVPVPDGVQPGDALLLFASQGTTAAQSGPGAGWTQAGRIPDGSLSTTVWRRVAAQGDAGTAVQLTTASTSKMSLTLAAYRGTDATNPVVSVTGEAETSTTGAHTTPQVPNTVTGARRVSYWADKNSATTSWSPPAGEGVRATSMGSGGGRVDALLTDHATALTAGTPATTGGLTAVADAASGTATSWTVLLRPGTDAPPENTPPTASFTRECDDMTCTFDGTGSSDAEDSIAAYEWDLGGGDSSTEPVVDHGFSGTGPHTVTLTVTDSDGATDTATQTFTLGAPPPTISFVDESTRNTNSRSHSVTVPSGVTTGDALLLFVSQGTTTALSGPGAGWIQADEVTDGGLVTTVWRKVATAGDAGSTLSLTSPSTQKVALTVTAYRGTDASNPIAVISGVAEPANTANHTSPSVTNATDGAWRLTYWADKTSATTSWDAPVGETTRATSAGTGGGRVGVLLTDSADPLTAGSPASTGSRTATASATSSTATMWTILLRPHA